MNARFFLAGILLAAFAALMPLSGARATVSGAGGGLVAYADGSGIVVVKPDGSSVHVTSDPTDANPSWNGEGKKIVFNRGTTLEIVTVPNPPASATAIPIPNATGSDPAFSPDGTKVAYVDGVTPSREIKLTTLDGTTITNLTNSSADDIDPAWNSDGSKLTFARKPAAGKFSIWTMNSDGTGQTQITASGANDTRPSYSALGTTIAFESDRDGATQHQIYSVSASGGSQTRLTNTATSETQPSYTPDGAKILYSDAAGIYSVSTTDGTVTAVPGAGGATNTAPEQQPLLQAGTPFITGSTNQGSTLTANTGTWKPLYGVTFSYQWQRCDATSFCVDVGTGSTYATTGADVGQKMQVAVTGTNAWASVKATSSQTAAITAGPGPVNTVVPTIVLPTGFDAPQINLYLSATTGTWTGQPTITYKYQWTKCDDTTKNCYDIDGATTSFYAPTTDLANWDISVTVYATNSVGTTYARAAPTLPVTGALPVNHGSPVITGQNYVKSQLTSTTGIWQGLTPITYAYQWKRCDAFGNLDSCVAIPGATGSTYVLQQADLDKTIRVFVTATNALKSVTQQSNHTFPTLPERHFKPLNSTSPVVTGTTRPGFLLRTTVGAWNGDFPQTHVYQWERCDATGAKCVAIRRATKNRYTLTKADLGSTIRVKVTATNAYGSNSVETDPTDPITVSRKLPKGRRIVGTSGPDYLPGGGGNDVIIGGAGNDTLLGGAGNDYLYGGPGNDVIDGGPGKDHIYGGPGSDTIRAADGEKDVIDCGTGNDRVVADAIDVLKNCESVSLSGAPSPTLPSSSPPPPSSP